MCQNIKGTENNDQYHWEYRNEAVYGCVGRSYVVYLLPYLVEIPLEKKKQIKTGCELRVYSEPILQRL